MSIIKCVKQNQELEKIETATLDSGWDIFLYLNLTKVQVGFKNECNKSIFNSSKARTKFPEKDRGTMLLAQ